MRVQNVPARTKKEKKKIAFCDYTNFYWVQKMCSNHCQLENVLEDFTPFHVLTFFCEVGLL